MKKSVFDKNKKKMPVPETSNRSVAASPGRHDGWGGTGPAWEPTQQVGPDTNRSPPAPSRPPSPVPPAGPPGRPGGVGPGWREESPVENIAGLINGPTPCPLQQRWAFVRLPKSIVFSKFHPHSPLCLGEPIFSSVLTQVRSLPIFFGFFNPFVPTVRGWFSPPDIQGMPPILP